MTALRLLLVEDKASFVDSYRKLLDAYVDEHNRPITMCVERSLADAKSSVNKSIDAAIVDLNLGWGTRDGGELIAELKEHFRVPVAVLTATPSEAEDGPPVVGVFTKGEHRFDEVLDRLWSIYETGLTRIMGGRGMLEKHLNRVFLTNLLPRIDVWVGYGQKDSGRTEKALLRYALGHLVADLEGDETPCYPEEVYLAPPLEDSLQTGSLVKCRVRGTCHVVMTPACDLVMRGNGEPKPKTDVVVVAQVLPHVAKSKRKRICFHELPKCGTVQGGWIDFRLLEAVPWNEFDKKFDRLKVRVAPSFIKDIVSRFSTFYARQGQPAIEADQS